MAVTQENAKSAALSNYAAYSIDDIVTHTKSIKNVFVAKDMPSMSKIDPCFKTILSDVAECAVKVGLEFSSRLKSELDATVTGRAVDSPYFVDLSEEDDLDERVQKASNANLQRVD